MQRKTQLRAKTPLKAKTPVKARTALVRVAKPKVRKRKTLEQKTAQELIREADAWFSKYIRLRDSEFNGKEWVAPCIDGCGKELVVIDAEGRWKNSANNGHFISRGVFSLRFDEMNTNVQSAHCNAWRDKEDMLEGYRQGLDRKYGAGTAAELKRLSKLPDAYKRPSKAELLQLIHDCKLRIDYILQSA